MSEFTLLYYAKNAKDISKTNWDVLNKCIKRWPFQIQRHPTDSGKHVKSY